MNIVRKATETAFSVLGEQSIAWGEEYRPLSFCVFVNVDGVNVVYNSLTGEIAELTEKETAALKSDRVLIDDALCELALRWYLVPVSHNDIGLSDEILEFVKIFESKKGISGYTIFTTTDCNARCFYCYELGRPRIPMSREVADDTVRFIEENKPSGKIKLSWFGGEPLFNSIIIDYITDSLSAKGIEFSSSMVSNGYLFDSETVSKAKEKWNLHNVQITLDGTADVYNKAKAFIYEDDKTPFATVTDNIELLLKAGISVVVRMNIGAYNKEDLYRLADFLADRYSAYKNFGVYVQRILETEKYHYSDKYDVAFASDLIDIEEYCHKKGILLIQKLPDKVCKTQCMADNPSVLTVLPTGKLGKCEHFTDSEFVGSLRDGVTDLKKVGEFCERGNNAELCSGCSAYPICIRLKKCPDLPGTCDAASRLIEEVRLKRRVEYAYRKIKEQKNKAK